MKHSITYYNMAILGSALIRAVCAGVIAALAVLPVMTFAFTVNVLTLQPQVSETGREPQVQFFAVTYYDDQNDSFFDRPQLYFEYGLTPSLGNTTQPLRIGTGNNRYFTFVDNLQTGNRYYVRAVVAKNGQLFYGDRVEFNFGNVNNTFGQGGTFTGTVSGNNNFSGTSGNQGFVSQSNGNNQSSFINDGSLLPGPNGTVISAGNQTTTSRGNTTSSSSRQTVTVGSGNPIDAKVFIENGTERLIAGDRLVYEVVMHNTSKTETITDSNLLVILPPEVRILSTSHGRVAKNTNRITYTKRSLRPGERDTVFIEVAVLPNERVFTDEVTAEARLGYTANNETSLRDEATATDTDEYDGFEYVALGTTAASASIFGSGGSSFLPTTLGGWLIVLAIIFGIIAVLAALIVHRRHHEEVVTYATPYEPEYDAEFFTEKSTEPAPAQEITEEEYTPYRPTPKTS